MQRHGQMLSLILMTVMQVEPFLFGKQKVLYGATVGRLQQRRLDANVAEWIIHWSSHGADLPIARHPVVPEDSDVLHPTNILLGEHKQFISHHNGY